MSEALVCGKVWRFGDDISTDLLAPGQYAVEPVEVQKHHVLESIDPTFAAMVVPGDVVVAGRNFGCGSSRETAPENLKALGVACVVAESFSRLFMRNAVAVGLPVLVCPGIHESVVAGDEIEIDLASGRIGTADGGASLSAQPLPPEMREILEAGGILALLRNSRSGETPVATPSRKDRGGEVP
ncbi:MAG: 3-isopropylmalate dehydratase small subunit [Actinomycetia bacterium]|nr:3-isopropylmalate dehydratase small subunit [Actinomycetes bacterium]MCP5030666.1 3-isopropylmalate dehydratase small subunit [Actinomycetes bacterium]